MVSFDCAGDFNHNSYHAKEHAALVMKKLPNLYFQICVSHLSFIGNSVVKNSLFSISKLL